MYTCCHASSFGLGCYDPLFIFVDTLYTVVTFLPVDVSLLEDTFSLIFTWNLLAIHLYMVVSIGCFKISTSLRILTPQKWLF